MIQAPSGGKTCFKVLNGTHWYPLVNGRQKLVPTGEGSTIYLKIFILDQFQSDPRFSRRPLSSKHAPFGTQFDPLEKFEFLKAGIKFLGKNKHTQ